MSEKKPKIVITDCDHPSVEIEKKILSEINPELTLETCKTEEDVIAVASDADGIINQYAPITRKVIESLKRCKVIARYGVGVDNIDVEAATEHKIIVANVPDYCVDEVSTHTIALILACARGITLLDRKIRDKKWDFTLPEPLTAETRHSFGENGLKVMKKNAYLINTSRGPIINEKDLYIALKEKWIAGAALDVMEKEPPDWENSLLQLDNLIITPHISFYSEESYVELKTKAAQAVLSVLKGELPNFLGT